MVMPWEDPGCACGHVWEAHSMTLGCISGWAWNKEGLAVLEGCLCKLAHVDRSNRDG